MNYKIISTGSKGNCIIIEDEIALDMGVPFKKIEAYYKKLKIVFISHEHKDHLLPSTVKKLAEERPMLRFICGDFLKEYLIECGVPEKNIDILKLNVRLSFDGFSFQPIKLYHDVKNFGLKYIVNKMRGIYITDTRTVEGIVAKNYNLYLIEGNYTEDEIEKRIEEKKENGDFLIEYRIKNTHLSVEEATEFLLKNMGNKGKFELIHRHVDKEK